MIVKAALLLLLFRESQPKATISNNGYEDIVVAISPDVKKK